MFVLSACSVLKTSIFSYWAKSSCVNTINLVVSHIKCTADISYYYEKYESESRSIASSSLWSHGRWNSPGQNTLVGCCSLLKAVFLTQGSNWGLLHCRQILYQLNHHGRPRILEWLAYPFSSISSQPRNWTWVSCIASGFFTSWATREALSCKH